MQNALMTLGQDALAVALIEYLRVSEMIKVGDNEMLNDVKMGALWTVADDIVQFISTRQSHFLAGDYIFFVDDTFFNTALFSFLSRSGLGDRVSDQLEGVIPLPSNLRTAVSTSVLRLSGKFFGQYLVNALAPSFPSVQYLTRISLLWNSRP